MEHEPPVKEFVDGPAIDPIVDERKFAAGVNQTDRRDPDDGQKQEVERVAPTGADRFSTGRRFSSRNAGVG